jgi:hypothetical protein
LHGLLVIGAVLGLQAARHGRAQPSEAPTHLHGLVGTLINAAAQELADQHAAAEARRAQGFAEHARKTAAKAGGVDLQQAFGLANQQP